MKNLAIALLLGLGLAGCAHDAEPNRVLVLGLDGVDPDVVDLLVSEGKLPNFARLRKGGAEGRLISEKPLLSPVIWTTLATGKTPDRHGIGGFTAVNPGTGESLPVTSRMRRVQALWNIFSGAGREVAVVGWWATWPPEPVRGAIVSDHASYHFLFREGFEGGGEAVTHPPELRERIAPLLLKPGDLGPADLAPFVDVAPEELTRPFDFEDDLAHFRWALATARGYRDAGLKLWREDRPDLAMVYIEGTDTASHLFGHLFRARGLTGELAEQQRRYGAPWRPCTSSPTASSATSWRPWTTAPPWSSSPTTASPWGPCPTIRPGPATCAAFPSARTRSRASFIYMAPG